MYVCLLAFLYACQYLCLYDTLPACLLVCKPTCVYIYLPACIYVCTHTYCLHVWVPICLLAYLFVCLYDYLLEWLPEYMSVYLPVSMTACLVACAIGCVFAAYMTACYMYVYKFFCSLLYILATSKVISGRVPTCCSAHSWQLYSVTCLGKQVTSNMTWYPTQSYYPDTEPINNWLVLIMPNTWLGSDNHHS